MALMERRDLKNFFFFSRVTGFQTVERMSLWQTDTPLEIVEEGLLKQWKIIVNHTHICSHKCPIHSLRIKTLILPIVTSLNSECLVMDTFQNIDNYNVLLQM